MKRSALSLGLALCAVLIFAVTASASTTYTDRITGTELPNATNTEGQFVGTSTGSYPGAWYIDVKHLPLWDHPTWITGGSFRLDTTRNGWPDSIEGTFVPYGGTVRQISGFSGCTNQTYSVHGLLSNVGFYGGGSGSFNATLTHYRANLWWVGCVVYSASVSGSVSLTF